MFAGIQKNIADKLIGLSTFLIVAVRILELFIDPLIGNIVDNTHTRWGKFKPWIFWGNIVSAVLMIVLFTGIFGLAKVNWVLYAILFVIIFITFDVFYSFSDVSYWGMVPALSEDSDERGIYTLLGAFARTIGWNGLSIIVVPVVTYFTYLATGRHNEGPQGWLAFAIIVSAVALLSAFIVCAGTQEKENLIRTSAKKTTIKEVFAAIFHNDQIMWPSLEYLLYSFAYVVTNGVLFYYFKFVLAAPNKFWLVGTVGTVMGFVTSPLFPILNKKIPRKWIFTAGQIAMMLAYLIFLFGGHNLVVLTIGLILFNFNYDQLVTVLTITDAIEYGQLKTGQRNEAVSLAVRPMIDKLTGAFSNGLVGWIALTCGMTGSATAKDMTAHNIHLFNSLAFYIPLAFAICSLLVFLTKVTLTEKKHAEVVEQLNAKLAAGKVAGTDEEVKKVANVNDGDLTTSLYAPVDGELKSLDNVVDEQSHKGFLGTGFAIAPDAGEIYAPYDGVIRFVFTTKHAFGIVSENGLETVVHVGLGTVNMRGETFTTHFLAGQKVKKGDLLLDFDRDQIIRNGYNDDVIVFFTQPQRIADHSKLAIGKKVQHGDHVMDVTLHD